MSYKCLECGHIFEDGEEKRWVETHGLDAPPYEEMSGCPLCLGPYRETTPCKNCGSEHLPSELEDGLCEECREGENGEL